MDPASVRRHVERLAGAIGPRSVVDYAGLKAAAAYIESELKLKTERQTYVAAGREVSNIIAEIPGGREVIVAGAHYDTVVGQPGANDNGSGVAAALVLARAFAGAKLRRMLRIALFVNEEPPFFQTSLMGSLVYAAACRKRGDRIAGMLSLETIGYYTDEPGTQLYPAGVEGRPSSGNFIAFASNRASRKLLDATVAGFRNTVEFPVESASEPAIDLSDHWSFWQHEYPALIVTDTAMFRYPHYHTREDTPEKLDYDRLAEVVTGLRGAIAALVR